MKIRTQLFIGLIVFALLLLIVSSLVITTNREVDRLNRGEALAQGIALKVGELGYLSNDYVLYREQLQADRWESKYASISADVANLSVNTPEQLAIVGGLQANLRNLRSIFDDLVSTPAAPAQAGGGPDPAFIQLSWSRLAIQNQGMVFDAGRLSDILRDEANTVKMENSLLTVSLMVLCSVFLLTSYLLFYRRALRSIAGLQEGAGVIGSGNLDHVIDVKGDDEISELSRAFNLMTASLKTVTAKKSDLEREMAERRQAEDALRENEARLRVLYESMTEGLAIHNVVYEGGDAVDYVVTDVNPAFEMITGLSRSVAVGRRATELYGTGSPPYLDVYSRVASGGAPEHFETYFPPMERHFAISVFSPGKGKFATVFTDITDRKRADEALRQLAQFPGQNPNPIMRITFEGALLYANPPAATWLGEMGWVEGEPVPAAVRTLVDSVGGDEYEHQTEITDRQGRVSWLVAVRPPGEAYVNVYGRDITLRKQVEEAIRQLNTELGRKADELLQANETLTASRKAALNLMEDAILARDALRESEARYRTVADNTYDWEFWIDPAGKFIYCSPSCEMITGRKADEFLADPDLRGKIIHPDDVPGFEEHQHEVHEKQGVGMGEWRYVRPDGTSCWVEHVCQPIYGAKGEFLGTRGSNRDITERKRAEVALQESERLLQDVMDGSPSPIFLKDRDGKFITINATLERMVGMSREAIKGKTDYDIAPGEVADYWQAHDSKVLGTGKAIQVEEVADLADGHHIFLANKFPLVDAGGEVYGVGAISHDITDRKRVEEALRESEERFRVLAEAMPQIVWSADASGSMDYYNQQAFVYGGVGLDEVKGWNWESLIHPDDLPATAAAWQKALGTGESSVIEHRLRRFDGEYRWHLTRGSPVRDEGGAIRRWIGTATDIHDLKRAEDALRESEERYRALVDSAPEAIIVHHHGTLLYANQVALDLYGASGLDELKSQDIMKLIPPEEEEIARGRVRGIDDGRHLPVREAVILRLDGARVPVEVISSPVRYEGTLAAQVLMRDISDRKKAEERIAHLASFPEMNPNPVIELSSAGEVIYTNPASAKTLENLGLGNRFGLFLPEEIGTMLPRLLEGDVSQEVHIGGRVFIETITLNPATRTTRIYARDITGRKQVEEALRETSDYLENLFNHANAPIIVWDPELRITRFNHAFENLTGRASGEVVGKGLEILFPAETAEGSMEYIRKVMAGERLEVVEIPILRRDGEVRTVLWNSATLYGADGTTVSSAIAQGQDITGMKLAGQRLRETSEYLENLINHANAPIIVWDREFRITRFNEAFERLTGRSAAEVVGQHLRILFPPESEAESMDLIGKALAGERWETVEIPIVPKDGEIRTVLWNSATIYEADGRTPSSAIAQGVDITEQKRMIAEVARNAAELADANAVLSAEILHRRRAEEEARGALSALNAALESTADAMLVIDRSGKITGYNQNFTAMWKVPDAVLHTLDTRAAVESMAAQVNDPEGFDARVQEILDHPQRESYDMLELRDGRVIERYSKPQRIGTVTVGRVFSFRDISERKRAEFQLIESLEEKEVLLREIHHRVKNNLQLTTSLLDMTRMRSPDPATAGILTDVMVKIQTMAQIHTRLYESKQFDRIDMDGQVRDQIRALASIYSSRERDIETEVDSPALSLPLDRAIPCALALNEILANAYKHAFRGRESGKVKYHAREEIDRIRFTVTDNGVGLPAGFDLGKANTLGLKLVRNLVEQQLKGSLSVKRMKRGTRVTVEIPFAGEEGDAGRPGPRIPPAGGKEAGPVG